MTWLMKACGLRRVGVLVGAGLLALRPLAPTRADTPSTPPEAQSAAVSGYVVDDGRCMDALFGPDAAASMPADALTLIENDRGGRFIVSRLAPAKRDAMLAWMTANVITGRFVVAIPETEDGQQVGWRGFCVVARPLLAASELALGASEIETDVAGVTRTWRGLTISSVGRTELELTMGHVVLFLDARRGFHGITTVARLLDAAPDEVFF